MSNRVVLRDDVVDNFVAVDVGGHLLFIDSLHNRIHAGSFFSAGISNAALANGAVLELLIQTPATGTIHLRGEAAAGGNAGIEMYEGTTFSAAGTASPSANHNRLSSNVSTVVVTHTPTLTADGSQLVSDIIIGGQTGKAFGGSVSPEEWLLDQSQVYLLRLTNTAGTVQPARIALDFYDTNF